MRWKVIIFGIYVIKYDTKNYWDVAVFVDQSMFVFLGITPCWLVGDRWLRHYNTNTLEVSVCPIDVNNFVGIKLTEFYLKPCCPHI